jgi:hypothetical protein
VSLAYLDGQGFRKLAWVFEAHLSSVVVCRILSFGAVIIDWGSMKGEVSAVETCEGMGVVTTARIERRRWKIFVS